jgi:hypothetical protein
MNGVQNSSRTSTSLASQSKTGSSSSNVLTSLGLDTSPSLLATAADVEAAAVEIAGAAGAGSSAATAASDADSQQGLRGNLVGPSGSSTRARSLLMSTSRKLGDLAQQVASKSGMGRLPLSVSGINIASAGASTMKGELSMRAWLLVGYVCVLHFALMMSFTSRTPAGLSGTAGLSAHELIALCGHSSSAVSSSVTAAAAAAAAASSDVRLQAFP